MALLKSLHQDFNKLDYLARVQFFLRFTPWQWLIAIAFFILSVSFYFVSILPKLEQLQQTAQQIEKLRANIPKHQAEWVANSPQNSLNAFYQSLPNESSKQQILMQVYAAAQEHHIQAQSAEYHLQPNGKASFSVYQITLPVTGQYTEIRSFINQLLNALPALALTGISFNRDETSNEGVNARISFTVYLKSRS